VRREASHLKGIPLNARFLLAKALMQQKAGIAFALMHTLLRRRSVASEHFMDRN
jgi:hypothetical protein